MKPLIKIRFGTVKQRPFKYACEFLAPAIFTLLIVLGQVIVLQTEKDTPSYRKIRNIPAQTLSLSELGQRKLYFGHRIGVICNNSEKLDEFVKVLKINSESDYIITYKDFSSYKKYTESSNYTKYDAVIYIKQEKEGVYEYEIMHHDLTRDEIGYSSDMLINEPGDDNLRTSKVDTATQLLKSFTLFEMKNGYKLNLTYKPLKIQPNYTMYSSETFIGVLPFLIAFGFYFVFFDFTLWMISDKEKKLNEFLFRQGITLINYLFSWILSFLLFMLPSILLNAILIGIFFTNFPFQNLILIFINLILFGLCIFSMCFFIQSFIDTIKTCQTIIRVIYLVVIFLSLFVKSEDIPKIVKLIIGLFPQSAEMFLLETIFKINNFENGIEFKLLTIPYRKLSVIEGFLLLIFDTILYFSIGLFIMKFRASGLSLIDYCKKIINKSNNYNYYNPDLNIKDDIHFDIHHQELTEAEKQCKKKNEILEINNVSKNFDHLIAVNNFTGDIFKDEIFCLLGHNGAGKTTLIKMISGLENLTEGEIILNGISLETNKEFLYSNLGLCSQEDIFFEDLTVEEHLQYMSEIKGQIVNEKEMFNLVTSIGLNPFMSTLCKNLSGGNKRKLCIALAIIGNSKLILLDEPTSGMDVFAKKDLWSFLEKYKKGRIIILTTHSLDEAEYLGDRIGIMSEGRYICSGSSSFLKSVYPCGFNLNLLINSELFKKDLFMKGLTEIDSTASVKIDSKNNFTINFINNGENVNQIFNYVEKNKINGIDNYTISSTTLEDVFIKLNNHNQIYEQQDKEIVPINNLSYHQVNFFSQLKNNLKKDFLSFWRSKFNFILDLLYFMAQIGFIALVFKSNIDAFLTDSELKDVDEIIKNQPIHFYSEVDNINKSYLTNSYYFNTYLKESKVIQDYSIDPSIAHNISAIDDYIYDHYKYHNERSFIFVFKNNDTYEIYNLFQFVAPDYYIVSMNVFLSAFFKNEFNIDISFNRQFAEIAEELESNKYINDKIMIIAVCFLVWNCIVTFNGYVMIGPIKDRYTNIKHLFYLSGGNICAYWLSYYLIDLIKMFIFLLFINPFLIILNKSFVYYTLVLIIFIFTSNLFVYVLSFFFEKEEESQKLYLIFTIISGLGLPLFDFLIRGKIYSFEDATQNFINPEKWIIGISDIFPHSTLLFYFIRIYVVTFLDNITNKLYLQVVGKAAIIFLCQIPLYLVLLICFEKKIFDKLYYFIIKSLCIKKNNQNIQNDFNIQGQLYYNDNNINNNLLDGYNTLNSLNSLTIDYSNNSNNTSIIQQQDSIKVSVKERQKERIKRNPNKFTTIIKGLSKTFCKCRGDNKKAVNDLYLALESNEKFGLLGYNGSGKTTTFKSITNELFYEDGEIILFDYNANKDFQIIRNMIGYCPQENALFDYLTVKEIIDFYQKLKGVNEPSIEIMQKFGLSKYINTYSKNLSGGNKRKLAFTIAMMSYPKLLLLDEPSTGVDPESRRVMWRNINKLNKMNHKYNMILSTHSIEEAEILCDTVGWLKEGSFMCLGNPEQLKLQCSAGYKLYIKFISQNIDTNDNLFEQLKNSYCQLGGNPDEFNYVISNNKYSINFINKVINVIDSIHDYCSDILINHFKQDGSFDITLHILSEKKSLLFAFIFGLKNNNDTISEISLNIEPLENILTQFN